MSALANYNAIADSRLRALNDAFEAIVRCGPKGDRANRRENACVKKSSDDKILTLEEYVILDS